MSKEPQVIRRQTVIEVLRRNNVTEIGVAVHPTKPNTYRVFGISPQAFLIWTEGRIKPNTRPQQFLINTVGTETADDLEKHIEALPSPEFRKRVTAVCESVTKKVLDLRANLKQMYEAQAKAQAEAESLEACRGTVGGELPPGETDMSALWKTAYDPESSHTITIRPMFVFHVRWELPPPAGAKPAWYSLELKHETLAGLIDSIFVAQDAARQVDNPNRQNHGLELVPGMGLLAGFINDFHNDHEQYARILNDVKHPRAKEILQADYSAWEKTGFAPTPEAVVTPALTAVPGHPDANHTPTLDDTPKSKADLKVVPPVESPVLEAPTSA